MKKNKIIFVSWLLFITLFSTAEPDTPKSNTKLIWHTDLIKAHEISRVSDKPLFAFFTGSDWCPWCKKLQNDVFLKPEFIKWAEKNVVLVELDFPRNKSLSPELIRQNSNLQQAFQVQGYPTVWMFFLNRNEDGTQYNIERLGSLGYPQGVETGKEELKFLKEANALLEKRHAK